MQIAFNWHLNKILRTQFTKAQSKSNWCNDAPIKNLQPGYSDHQSAIRRKVIQWYAIQKISKKESKNNLELLIGVMATAMLMLLVSGRTESVESHKLIFRNNRTKKANRNQ